MVTQDSKILLFITIVMSVCLTQLASDIYAPSLPTISHQLNTPINWVQASMAIYMLGVALTQLIYGPISEGIGRKTPLLIGLIIMLLGTILCTYAPTIEILILGRFIQGCGAGACAALWRTIFRDIFEGDDLSKYGSYLGSIVMFIVPAAPTLGAYLQTYFSWRANFVFMTIYAIVAILLIFFGFKETSKHHHRDRLKLAYVFSTYRALITDPIFLSVTCCTFLCYGAFFSWFVVGPVLFIKSIGITPQHFGYINLICAGSGYIMSGWLNGKFVKRFGTNILLRFGLMITLLSGVVLLILKFLLGLSVWSLAIPLFIFYFGSTFIWPNAFAIAFTPFGKIAGYAGAMYGFMQICGAAVLGGLLSYLPDTDQIPLAIIIVGATTLSLFLHKMVISKVARVKNN